jgi:hypothetical protein
MTDKRLRIGFIPLCICPLFCIAQKTDRWRCRIAL